MRPPARASRRCCSTSLRGFLATPSGAAQRPSAATPPSSRPSFAKNQLIDYTAVVHARRHPGFTSAKRYLGRSQSAASFCSPTESVRPAPGFKPILVPIEQHR